MKKVKALKYSLFFVPLVIAGAYFPTSELNKDEVLMQLVMQNLNTNHFVVNKLDENFSKNVFKLYLQQLDFNKTYLTQQDVATLAKYETQLGKEIEGQSYEFFNLSNEIWDKRVRQAEGFANEILAQPLDLYADENFETDDDKRDFPKDEAALKDVWRKSLKASVLSRVVSALEVQESLQKQVKEGKKKAEEVQVKTVAQLEKEAREGLAKDMKNLFDTYKEMEKPERMARYINSITANYDPHTNYYAPRAKERFDEDFSGRFEGIGAQLQQRDGIIKVMEVIPGSASWRQGQLKTGDIILKVGQGSAEPVDVSTMRLDNAVRLIRGKKGSEVRLTVKKVDGNIVVIPIIRDVVVKEETYAKSVIVQHPGDKRKIGYIYLPGFYADFSRSGGRNCAEDIKKELAKLQAEGAEGIVLDLRNNTGGSLEEVIKMVGLFIEKGPVVQVKYRTGSPVVYDDTDPAVQYNGPLAVMVNSYSASASEILAGAIQDYKRGVIIGGASTFGKGTVQTVIDLDRMLPPSMNDMKPMGSLFLTIQKFYRINGGTNQLKGVVPDVVLPDAYRYLKVGEKEEYHPLPWDEIKPLKYNSWPALANKLDQVKAKSAERVNKNATFALIEKNALRLKQQRDETTVSLHLDKYRAQLAKDREEAKKFEAISNFSSGLNITSLKTDLPEINLDSTRIIKNKAWHDALKKDIYLLEATQVMKDIM